jgi:hypothetical protein
MNPWAIAALLAAVGITVGLIAAFWPALQVVL